MDKDMIKLTVTDKIFKDFLDILHKENPELIPGEIWHREFINQNGLGNYSYHMDIYLPAPHIINNVAVKALEDNPIGKRLHNMAQSFINYKIEWGRTPYDGSFWNGPMLYIMSHHNPQYLLDKLTYLCSENKLDETFIPINI